MKKWRIGQFSFATGTIIKCLLIMKLTAIFILIGCLQVQAKGYSQEKINLNLRSVKIKNVLLSIQSSTSYHFIYNDDLLPQSATISIQVQDAAVEDVLQYVLKGTQLTFRMLENNLIVIARQAGKPLLQVNGTVRLRNGDSSLSTAANISVMEKGTSNGTVTSEQGAYSLTLTDANAVLQVSYIGYHTAEINVSGRQVIDVVLETAAKQMEEVVVTALGITRQKRSIPYATQTLDGDELSGSREMNITSAMNGKVAGLTINKTNSGPGGSNRIVFRGNRSIGRTNQPLLVVDGVRVDNSPKAGADVALFGARDNGDGISNINPDDIESMTVLTGASAAALYGSDASNGAILVTTKRGKAGKGIGIQISSSASLETPMVYPELQNVYGQGDAGVFVPGSANSWGPKMTGQNLADWTGKSQSFTPQPDNYKDFFRTGSAFINSVATSTGNEKSQTYFSYTNSISKGILPNNDFKRNNVTLRQTMELAKGLSMDIKGTYMVEDILNRPLTGAGNRMVSTITAMPRNLRLSDIKNFETLSNEGVLTQNYWANQTPSFQNPYWSAYRNLYDRNRKRFMGLASLRYQFNSELSIQVRTSLDYYADVSEEKDYNDTYWLSDYPGRGNYIVSKESNQLFNNDLLISYSRDFNDFSITANAGASIEQFNFERTTLNNRGLNTPNLFATSNAVALTNDVYLYIPFQPIARTEKQSVYASAQLGYKNYLFLDLTGRNDWNSTLPIQNASYFFPSAGISAVLSDALRLPAAISLLKLRSSYAFVGNGTGFNEFKPSFALVSGGNNGFLLIDRSLRNADLKPEETRSFEAGIDLGLMGGRFGAEFTFYNTNTINQILTIPVPAPSGYSTRIINAGKIRNRGIELLVNAGIIDVGNFKWSMQVNFGANTNTVVALDSLQRKVSLSSPQALGSIVVEEGKRFGDLYTSSMQRNATGQIIVDVLGKPLLNSDQAHYVGNFNPDWTAGIANTFRFKAWSLSVLIDERKGGTVISGTQFLAAGSGTAALTQDNRETGFVIPNSVLEGGGKNNVPITAQDYWSHLTQNSIGELFAYSATNIRLREAQLSYTLPLTKHPGSFIKGCVVSLVGRNLFFLKNNADGFDPESALGTGNNQGIEYASLPSTRSVGLYLKLNF